MVVGTFNWHNNTNPIVDEILIFMFLFFAGFHLFVLFAENKISPLDLACFCVLSLAPSNWDNVFSRWKSILIKGKARLWLQQTHEGVSSSKWHVFLDLQKWLKVLLRGLERPLASPRVLFSTAKMTSSWNLRRNEKTWDSSTRVKSNGANWCRAV